MNRRGNNKSGEGGGKPRGKRTKVKHDRSRGFADAEEIERRNAEMQRREEESSGEEDEEESSSEEESEDSEEEKERKVKGPNAIETVNLNRTVNPNKAIKASELDTIKKPELSRKEREALEKEKKKKAYLDAYAKGKIPEARADLARLQRIRAEREAAARKTKEEIEAKEEASQSARNKANKAKSSTYL